MILVQVGSRNYSPLDRVFEAGAPLDPSVSKIKITLTRESWPLQDQKIMDLSVEYSLDGGATWAGAGTALLGGDIIGRDGVTPEPTTIVTSSVPNVGQVGRLVRGHVISLATLRTAITVEAL